MEILTHPNPALRQPAADVDPAKDPGLKELVERMAELMYEAPGIGLAATQIGVQKRLFIYDLDDGLVVLCNPRLTSLSQETEVDEEGCLSVPGIGIPVERALAVVCEAVDLEGNPVRIEGTELLARVLQHEMDHLDGVLILDRATPEDRKAALRSYLEAHSAG